jgi:hypothetical protein
MQSSNISIYAKEFLKSHGLHIKDNFDYQTFDFSLLQNEKYPLSGRRWNEDRKTSPDAGNLIVPDIDRVIKYDFSILPRSIINYFSDTIFQMWQIWEQQQTLIDPVNDPEIYAEVDRLNWISSICGYDHRGHN